MAHHIIIELMFAGTWLLIGVLLHRTYATRSFEVRGIARRLFQSLTGP